MPISCIVLEVVAGVDDLLVPDGAAGLGDVLHPALPGPLHVVPKGEEGVAAKGDAGHSRNPLPLHLRRENRRADGKGPLPAAALGEGGGIGDIQVDGVVPVGAADIGHKGQLQHLGMLPQPPDVRLVPRQAGAVDAALLPTPMVMPSFT